jgi:hypothetical protein
VHLAVRNADECGDVAVQIQQGVHLDGGLVLTKFGPREQRQAQVDGRGIQSVKAVLQVDAHRIAGVERPGDADQDLSEVGVNAPVMRVVGVGQRGARHAAVEAHVIELASQGAQACFYVAKTISISQLGEGHRQILVPARETSRPRIAAVALYTPAKLAVRQKAQQLREDGSALVHAPLLRLRSRVSGRVVVQIAARKIPRNSQYHKGLPADQGLLAGQ